MSSPILVHFTDGHGAPVLLNPAYITQITPGTSGHTGVTLVSGEVEVSEPFETVMAKLTKAGAYVYRQALPRVPLAGAPAWNGAQEGTAMATPGARKPVQGGGAARGARKSAATHATKRAATKATA